MSFNRENFWLELAAEGEAKVRANLLAQRYGPPNSNKERFAKEWLREQEQERARAESRAHDATQRAESMIAKQIEVARSVRNATWAAAIVALISAIAAVISAIK
jgi:hypothetical protein